MLFDKITLENFASYKDINEIDLRPETPDKPIILIGGENGCGKTTLLDALQLVIFGPLAQCSNRGKLSYSCYLEKCINYNTDPEEGSALELIFRFDIGNTKKYHKIRRSWAMKKNKLDEEFSVFHIEDDVEKYDKVLSDNWLDYIEGVFPSKIAPFFLFDGEKIEQLADFEKSGPIIRSAISSLLGLDHIDRLSTDLITLEKKNHKAVASIDEKYSIDEIEREIEYTKNKIFDSDHEIARLNNQHDRQKKKIEDNEMKYRLLGGDLYDRRAELEARHEKSKEALHQYEEELRQTASNSAPLLLVQDLLKDIQSDVNNESDTLRAQLLCESLVNRDQCLLKIIETLNLDRHTSSKIGTFLEEDRASQSKIAQRPLYLNFTQESTSKLIHLTSSELPIISSEIPIQIEKIHEATEQVESCERLLASIPEEAALANIIIEREKLQEDLRRIEYTIYAKEELLRKIRYDFERSNQTLKKTLDNLSNINLQDKNAKRMLDYAKKTRKTLVSLRKKVLESHLHQIEDLILESFNKLLRKKDLIHELRINPETFCLHLYSAGNHEITPERLSAGERQLLATAILWGICRAAGKPLPTIIDTPLGRLDGSHRSNLLTSYFPHASHQVILLSTDEEIVGRHYDAIRPFISHEYLLTHNDREGVTKAIRGYFIEKLRNVA